jgi:hypothetical protein
VDTDPAFSPEARGSLINNAIDLALIFKCSPYEFLERDGDEINRLARLVAKRMKEIEAESQD